MDYLTPYFKYWPYALAVSLAALWVWFFLNTRSSADQSTHVSIAQAVTTSSDISGASLLHIDISGAVVRPGYYSLIKGSRVVDAVNIAGGIAATAHTGYLSQKLNLSEELHDGEKIYIPFIFDEQAVALTDEITAKCLQSVSGVRESTATVGTQAVVNINTSTKDELVALPGIGDVTADKIIQGRPYATLDSFYTYIKFSTKLRSSLEGVLTLK